MRYEILEDGKVVNRIVADEAFVKRQYKEYRELPEPPPDPNIAILAELAAIDTTTGMSRTMREQLAAMPTATAYLKSVEAQAATLRGKLK